MLPEIFYKLWLGLYKCLAHNLADEAQTHMGSQVKLDPSASF